MISHYAGHGWSIRGATRTSEAGRSMALAFHQLVAGRRRWRTIGSGRRLASRRRWWRTGRTARRLTGWWRRRRARTRGWLTGRHGRWWRTKRICRRRTRRFLFVYPLSPSRCLTEHGVQPHGQRDQADAEEHPGVSAKTFHGTSNRASTEGMVCCPKRLFQSLPGDAPVLNHASIRQVARQPKNRHKKSGHLLSVWSFPKHDVEIRG